MKYCNSTTYEILKPIPASEMEYLFINYDVVADIVSKHYGITRYLLKSKSGKRVISVPRQVAMELSLIFVQKASTISVGAYYDRDHSTVIYAKNTVQDLCDVDKTYREKYMTVRLKIEEIQAQIKRLAA